MNNRSQPFSDDTDLQPGCGHRFGTHKLILLLKEKTMNRNSTRISRIALVLGSAAIGAVIMYVLDPDRGRRRRALVRDKIYSAALQTRRNVYARSRDLANRTKGMYARARHTLH